MAKSISSSAAVEGLHTISPPIINFSPMQSARVNTDLGKVEFEKNAFEGAYSHFLDAFEILRKENKENSLEAVDAAFNVGKCLQCLGRHTEAFHFYDIFTKSLFSSEDGADRYDLLTEERILNLQWIAHVFHQQNFFESSNCFYQLTLSASIKVLGEEHLITTRVLNQCGNLAFENGDMAVALRCYEKGLEIEEKMNSCRGKCHPDLIITMTNIAYVHIKNGSLDCSLKMFQRIIDSLKSGDYVCEPMVSDSCVADILLSAAAVNSKLGHTERALEILLQVLEIQRKEFGDEHSLVASTLNEIGIAYAEQDKKTLALTSFQKSLKIRKTLQDPELNLSPVLFNMARIHVKNGDNDAAQECFDELILHGGS